MNEHDERKGLAMHKFGDCSVCGGSVHEDIVELDYRYKGRLFVFRHVPAGVCQQCGEKYLQATTAKTIEHTIHTKKDWQETMSVPVGDYNKIVAPGA